MAASVRELPATLDLRSLGAGRGTAFIGSKALLGHSSGGSDWVAKDLLRLQRFDRLLDRVLAADSDARASLAQAVKRTAEGPVQALGQRTTPSSNAAPLWQPNARIALAGYALWAADDLPPGIVARLTDLYVLLNRDS